jgi:AraC-like DNA-binding protein
MHGDQPTNELVRAFPDPALRRFVKAYHGYCQRGVPPGRHRGLPSPFLTVIFTFDEPLHIAQHVDRRQAPGSYLTLAGGLHTVPALISHNGTQCGIQLEMSPLGARALLGMPAGELAGIDLDGTEVFGKLAAETTECLAQARSWPERFAILDCMLRRALRGDQTVPDEISHAWQCLLRSRGSMPVAQLVREIGWSDRHLASRFRTDIGLTSKAAARVIRFHHARRVLQTNGVVGLADVAASCGYNDQSHLVRDFVQFAGCPPSTRVRDEFGNFQAILAADEQCCDS